MKPPYASLIENSAAFTLLKRDADRKKLFHAYLLNAADGYAGALTMRLFAAYCLAKENGEQDAELVYLGRHADVTEIPRQKDTVAVADVDALIAGLYKRPSRGEYKFYLINHAETLSTQCQNKLLKTLEEPPRGTVILLNCRNLSSVLPTVLSRCRRIDVLPFSESALRGALWQQTQNEARAALAASLSGGFIERAHAFSQNEKAADLFFLCADVLLSLNSSRDVLDAVTAFSAAKDQIETVLDYIEMLLRDAAVYQTGAVHLCRLQTVIEKIERLSQSYTPAALEKILPFLGKIRRRARLNANQNSIWDELIFTLAEFRAIYKP
ncbi:MAG: hypothetical protein FWH03_01660 [Firmicutes bacterium]|nr:hypothetical protein [Bacillota bacterium]